MIDKKQLIDTTLKLAAVPGISGTESENRAGDKIIELLKEIPYFTKHPECITKIELQEDAKKRFCVAALLKGKVDSKRTIIISGHLDVVDAKDYGHLETVAFDPYECTKRINELNITEDARKDLESGDWLFGRGIADMKCGLALGIELLREYSENQDFRGNLLFLAVPGEETNSEGMLAAVNYLNDLQKQGYEFLGLLMPECYEQKSPADKKAHIYIGACGKINAMFFFAGKGTHADEPFHGLNPNSLSSEVNRLLDLNVDFCDHMKNNFATPPVCIKQTDLKDLYSVTTPMYSASYYSIITYQASAEMVMTKLKYVADLAFHNVLQSVHDRRKAYEELIKTKLDAQQYRSIVCDYSQIYAKVKEIYGDSFDVEMNGMIREWISDGMDNQTIAIHIVKETYERYPQKEPMIIVGFIPPYYPHRLPNWNDPKAVRFLSAIHELVDYARSEYSEELSVEDFYGISDLSYTGLNDRASINEIQENLLGLGLNYIFPIDSLEQLDIQGAVVGGWAKDFHQPTERLNLPFFTDVLPNLYRHLINQIFSKQ